MRRAVTGVEGELDAMQNMLESYPTGRVSVGLSRQPLPDSKCFDSMKDILENTRNACRSHGHQTGRVQMCDTQDFFRQLRLGGLCERLFRRLQGLQGILGRQAEG